VDQSVVDIVARLLDRDTSRSEATIQSDVRQLLLVSPFELQEDNLDAPLEIQVGGGRRIDIEIGLTVIEIKRDLRRPSAKTDAIKQLADYVTIRCNDLNQRYSGLLTDGLDWYAYHLAKENELVEVSHFELTSAPAEIENFIVWLDGFLATRQELKPTPREIERRLGAKSSAHALDRVTIATLYQHNKDRPTVALKRELWAKLLRTALGTQFSNTDDLFVEHTLLVLSSEVIAHAVVGFDLSDINPASLVKGALFTQAQIFGVVEADFFDWVIEVADGDRFVRSLARRLKRFSWSEAEHDVMKTLYESVIDVEQRKALGEYYTPDWLARFVVEAAVTKPAEQRVLDPACGSGTFLFHAVKHHLSSLEAQGKTVPEQLKSLTNHVFGIDIHPVAVTLARVTYLLGIGNKRLQHPDREAISVPVFLGDTLQWNASEDMLSHQMLVVPTTDQRSLIPEELRFPERLLNDTQQFDSLVAELADRVMERKPKAAIPSLSAIFRRYAIHEEDRHVVAETFALMCSLHDQGRDHIWGYYIRNVARPMWLSRLANRVDVLVGNPPWLSYRFMPSEMQRAFKELCQSRGLWEGAAVATNQDLSGLFVARTIQLYLRMDGRFGYVLPEAVLTRSQFKGFRMGIFKSKTEPVAVQFATSWSLNQVKPAFFPVPASAVFGIRHATDAVAMPSQCELWSGQLGSQNASWEEASSVLARASVDIANHEIPHVSPYHDRFSQGASVVPRVLFIVEKTADGPLGSGAGRIALRSSRSNQEKAPWKSLPGLEGSVEAQFVRKLLVGESLLPFSLRSYLSAVIPWDGTNMLGGDSDSIDLYPGLARWWRAAEAVWQAHRSSENLSLIEQLNYRNKLTDQTAAPGSRVVYSASGMYLVACRVSDPRAIVDKNLYWAAAATDDEALYLTAILNSPVVTERVRPLQARGEHNPRHFDKHIWKLPIPGFDDSDEEHRTLAELALRAEELVAGLTLPSDTRFENVRRFVRDALVGSDIGTEMNRLTTALLDREQGA